MAKKKRIGVYGGTFDPFHLGHLNSLETVYRELALDQIFIIPAHQSPGRSLTAGPSAEQRAELVRAGIREAQGNFVVRDLEVRRGGISYSVDTLRELRIEQPETEFYLIIGMDQFEVFDRWRDFHTILEISNLVVTTRPGHPLPLDLKDLPGPVAKVIVDFSPERARMTGGREIVFVSLDDVEASATEIRRRIRLKQDISDLVPGPVGEIIKAQGLYQTDQGKIGDFLSVTRECADFLMGKGAIGVIPFDFREIEMPTEFAILCSGTSTRQAIGLADNLQRMVKDKYGVYPLNVEGQREGRWVVVDYGALIVHVMYDFTRQEYKLEELWKRGKVLEMSPATGI